MKNEYYFQVEISDEQIGYANGLVEYSIVHHPVEDVFAKDPGGKERQRELRLTGTLGEVMFADMYGFSRPKRAFGAIDGQDHGMDFNVLLSRVGVYKNFDIKTMARKSGEFRENFVQNLAKYQMIKKDVVSDIYFSICIHSYNNRKIVSFLGEIEREKVLCGQLGILYPKGSKRVKDDGTVVNFYRDTYEVDYVDIISPSISEIAKNTSGFKIKHLLPSSVKNLSKVNLDSLEIKSTEQ